ncbi:hypothetical protein GC173_16945 [bacterium]|nr:hypothetical protein [bacterium]
MKKIVLSVVVAALVALSPVKSAAEVIFSNDAKGLPAAASKKMVKASATEFIVKEPMLVTRIWTAQSKADVATEVRVLRNGTAIYSEMSLAGTPNAAVVNPYLVFAPGSYTLELSVADSWKRNPATGAGIAVVEGQKASLTETAAAVSSYLLTPEGAAKPFSLTDALHAAKISTADLKQNVKDQTAGLSSTVESARSKMGKEIGAGRTTPGGESKGPSSGRSKAFEGLKGEGMAPPKYADTFGGERWNSGRTGSPSNFSGGGKGQTSSGDEDDLNATIAGMLTDAGGTVTDDPKANAEEAAYMMSVGSDGWEATKNMSKDERKSYWEKEQNRQMLGVGRPRDDQDQGGPFIIFGNENMRRAMFQFQAKAIAARRGQAGAPEQQAGGTSGVRLPASKDDKPMPERNMGTINWDRIMEINETVNPTRH